jgi:hypothetical protein
MCCENPDLDWLKSFNDYDREHVRHFISEAILATDVARHGDILKAALAFVDRGPQCCESTSISEASDIDSDCSRRTPKTYFNRNDPQHRLFIGMLLLHSADISNPVNFSFEVASDWAIRVAMEFTKQAEKEQQLKLPVTSFMQGLDSQYKIATMQIGFFKFMVRPLFHTLGNLFPNLKMMERWGERNCTEYQALIDAHDLTHDMNS